MCKDHIIGQKPGSAQKKLAKFFVSLTSTNQRPLVCRVVHLVSRFHRPQHRHLPPATVSCFVVNKTKRNTETDLTNCATSFAKNIMKYEYKERVRNWLFYGTSTAKVISANARREATVNKFEKAPLYGFDN